LMGLKREIWSAVTVTEFPPFLLTHQILIWAECGKSTYNKESPSYEGIEMSSMCLYKSGELEDSSTIASTLLIAFCLPIIHIWKAAISDSKFWEAILQVPYTNEVKWDHPSCGLSY
jgi:hypothetical protein